MPARNSTKRSRSPASEISYSLHRRRSPSVVAGAVICGRAGAGVTRKLAASLAPQAMLPDTRIEYLERPFSISDRASNSFWPALFNKEFEFEREFVKRGGLLLAGLDPAGYGGVIARFGDQREVLMCRNGS